MYGRRWSLTELAVLHALYEDGLTTEIARLTGRSVRQVQHKAREEGLRKSHEAKAELARIAAQALEHGGKKTRFQVGQKPWNAGRPFDAGGRSAETRFRLGCLNGAAAKKYMPIGSERIADGGYLQRKVSCTGVKSTDWVPVHHLVWLAAGREIPYGYQLGFKNGNKSPPFDLDNLELVSKADRMRRNAYQLRYPGEIAKLIQLRGAIRRQINKIADQMKADTP
jgi:hypothetical protein